jgi:hypothetical protein
MPQDNIRRTKRGANQEDCSPLPQSSAYDIFFHMERKRIMKQQTNPDVKRASVESDNLNNTISARWKKLKKVDGALKIEMNAMAKLDKDRYDREKDKWKANMMFKKADKDYAAAKVEPFADAVAKTPASIMALSEPSITSIATTEGSRRSVSVKSGADIPPLPFERNPRPQGHQARFSSSVSDGGGRSLADEYTWITPGQSRPTFQQQGFTNAWEMWGMNGV